MISKLFAVGPPYHLSAAREVIDKIDHVSRLDLGYDVFERRAPSLIEIHEIHSFKL